MTQLTLRAALTGFFLGGILSATNLYVGVPLDEEPVPIGARLRMLIGCVLESFTDAELVHMLFDLELYGLVEGTPDSDTLMAALELERPEREALGE